MESLSVAIASVLSFFFSNLRRLHHTYRYGNFNLVWRVIWQLVQRHWQL